MPLPSWLAPQSISRVAPAAWTVCPTARLCVPVLSRYDRVGVTSDGGAMSTVTLREVVELRPNESVTRATMGKVTPSGRPPNCQSYCQPPPPNAAGANGPPGAVCTATVELAPVVTVPPRLTTWSPV